ncbi:MAG: hypothetical protein HOP29_09895, partial [Phycisphaerales bacterium]|nr:hypothetical protein [Phycisphaerales bacterium]
NKLAHALDQFQIDPADCVCADLGCNVGGFTDCLLRRGARRVYAVDTGFGALDWKLRRDPRVVVMERTNALHLTLPEPIDLVTIDVAWTRQTLILPRALELIRRGPQRETTRPNQLSQPPTPATFAPHAPAESPLHPSPQPPTPAQDGVPTHGIIISLIKPHYEADPHQLRRGRLDPESAARVVDDVIRRLAELRIFVECTTPSPLPGDAGNREWLALIRLTPTP